MKPSNGSGLRPSPHPCIQNARTVALKRTIQERISYKQFLPSLNDDPCLINYRFRVATDLTSRAKAFSLAKQVYNRCGYSDSTPSHYRTSTFDTLDDTFTLLAENTQGDAVATVSLVFDSPHGLPCDEIFKGTLSPLRAQPRKLVEVTRLAMQVRPSESKAMIVHLFNLIYIHARHVKHHDDFVIEVNPRHVGYYDRLLCFEKLSGSRACPRVHGAPAVLLRLNLLKAQQRIQANRREGIADSRNLYGRACSEKLEEQITRILKTHYRPMSSNEARHFGLSMDPS